MLTPGSTLGHFEILLHIGRGGMGDVYKARDTRLNRVVAIKTSQARFNERFTREARAIAALNHPNIATLYDVGPDYLVMEFVDGEPVKGPLAHEEALAVSKQIVDAIEAAHDKAIIHRDLKPGNILRREDGTVKVLDFGLAKALENDEAVTLPPGPDSPTLTMEATKLGMVLGTAAYMSPEQAKGKRADRRADIFSFGVVLYELLTGKKLFTGESTGEILAAVIKEEAKLDAVPENWRGLLARCLHKDPRQRLQSIGEARIQLEQGMVGERLSVPTRSRFGAVGWAVAAAALAGLGYTYFRAPAPEPQPAAHLQIVPPEGFAQWAIISPDGASLALTTREGILLRSMTSGESRLLPGTEAAVYPFWSPDSKNVAFFQTAKLRRIAVDGGPAVDICPAPDPRGGAWSKDNIIVFAPTLSGGLFRVPVGGGTPQIVIKPTLAGTEYVRYPSFLPDGKSFLYQHVMQSGSGVFLGFLDGAPSKKLTDNTGTNAIYASGRLLFRVQETLMSQAFDLKTLELAGDPQPIAERVGQAGASGSGAFWVSGGGALVFASATARDSQMTWANREGWLASKLGSSSRVGRASISADGKQVTYQDGQRLFLQQIGGGPPTQIAGDDRAAFWPVWGAANQVVFTHEGRGTRELFLKNLTGAAKEESLGVVGQNVEADDWSEDGKWLIYHLTGEKTGVDLWMLPIAGERKPVAFLQTPGAEFNARFSPDGKWMAYQQGTQTGGQSEVFVQAISATGQATGIQYRVSADGGTAPRWRRDGKELLYSSAGKVIAVPVTLGATVQLGMPQTLFDLPDGATVLDMTRDAQRFLLSVPAGGAPSNALTVILNWPALVK